MRLKELHPAVIEGRTINTKKIINPSKVKNILKLASANKKIGNGLDIVEKGPWKGMPVYTLTLEERKTCPSDCFRWRECYGNSMFYAHRMDHTAPEFLPLLTNELEKLNEKHKIGFVVRLHVLGDFYSVEYVGFWESMLDTNPMLNIFGYTARVPNTVIGEAIQALNKNYPDRVIIRVSSNNNYDGVSLAVNEDYNGQSITCPEQLDKTESCVKCGLCLNPSFKKHIKFLEH